MTWGRTAAAAAAVALLLAGCSSGGAAHESAEPAGVAESAAESVEPVAESEWVDVSGQGVTLPRDDEGAQYSPEPAPGVLILHWPPNGGGEAGSCTLGRAVRQTTTGRTGFLTAGHCAKPPFAPEQYLAYGPGPEDVVREPLGALVPTAATEDVGVIWTPQAAGVSTVAGFPVIGALSDAEVRDLPEGTWACVNGAVSGVACAPLYSVTSTISYGHTEPGDSGAPMFLVNRKHEAVLVGVHTGGYTAAVLDHTLRRLDLQPITAG